MKRCHYRFKTIGLGPVIGLISLFVNTAVVEAQQTQAAWLCRGNDMAVMTTELDAWRGFHQVVVEFRTLDSGGRFTLKHRQPVLAHARVRWLRLHGEYDLYLRDLRTARKKLQRTLAGKGYRPLRTLPVRRGLSSQLTLNHPLAARSPAYMTLGHARLVALVTTSRGRVWVTLTNPKGGHRFQFTMPQAGGKPGESPDGLSWRPREYRLDGLRVSADGRWAVFALGTGTLLKGERMPHRRIRTLPVPQLMRRLGISRPSTESGGPRT